MLTLRPFITGDMAKLLEIDAESYLERAIQEEIESIRMAYNCQILVCFKHFQTAAPSSEMAGFIIWIDHRPKGHRGNILNLRRLAVAPRHRRQGAGRLLLAELNKQADKTNQTARGLVDEQNLTGQQFARACHWQATHQEPADRAGRIFYRFEYNRRPDPRPPAVDLRNRITGTQ